MTKDQKDTQSGKITITSNLIKFRGTIIPIRSVSRFRSYEIKRDSKQALTYGGTALAISIAAIVLFANNKEDGGLVVFAIAIGFAAAAIRAFLFKKYGLGIETNGGTHDFLISNNKKFSEDVLALIQYALENIDPKTSFIVNMDNRTIKEGDRFENINGQVNIATRGSSIN